MALTATLYKADDDRQADRYSVEVDATLRDPANVPLDTIVLDISTTGFRATVNETMAPGTGVRLGLPGLGVNTATVVWQSGSVIGCQFDHPIADDGIVLAQSTRTVVAGDFPTEGVRQDKPAPSADNQRWRAAGMPFAAAFAISTGISAAWSVAMVQLVRTALVDVFVA